MRYFGSCTASAKLLAGLALLVSCPAVAASTAKPGGGGLPTAGRISSLDNLARLPLPQVEFGKARDAAVYAAATRPNVEKRLTVFTTAYTYWDNTPPASADISHPILHRKAGGTGTYADPITIAVGHSIIDGEDVLDYPAGTRFYIPNVRRYFIVEDGCGDGPRPQYGACHVGYPRGTSAWFDLWIDGKNGTRAATIACAEALTGARVVIQNPEPNYAVERGPVFDGGCTRQFGDALALL